MEKETVNPTVGVIGFSRRARVGAETVNRGRSVPATWRILYRRNFFPVQESGEPWRIAVQNADTSERRCVRDNQASNGRRRGE